MGLFNKIANLFGRNTKNNVSVGENTLEIVHNPKKPGDERDNKAVYAIEREDGSIAYISSDGTVQTEPDKFKVEEPEKATLTPESLEAARTAIAALVDKSFAHSLPELNIYLYRDDLEAVLRYRRSKARRALAKGLPSPDINLTLNDLKPEDLTLDDFKAILRYRRKALKKETRRKLTPQERGHKGGKARMRKLTPQRRSEIAKLASIAAHAKRERERAERK